MAIQKTINIAFKPHYYQEKFAQAWKRFNLLVCTRRFGKTTFAVNALITAALQNKRRGLPPRYAFVAPVKDQAREMTWPFFRMYLSELTELGLAKIDDSGMEVRLTNNNAVIKLYGTDKGGAEPIRGKYLDGCVMDEYDNMQEYVWSEIVRPTLGDFKGWVLKCGTIKGHANLYKDWLKYREDSEWNVGRYKLSECWQHLPAYDEEEVERIKKDYQDKWATYLREYECDFDADCDDILIPGHLITGALGKEMLPSDYGHAPVILGVDVARYGSDSSCIIRRQGMKVWHPKVINNVSNMELADEVMSQNLQYRPDAIFIDAGAGMGVIDRLKQLNLKNVIEVNFGGRSSDKRYYLKRTQMWFAMRDWLSEGGALPNDERLCAELPIPHYSFNVSDQFVLETKDKIKERTGGKSPDVADALALTFAHPVLKQDDIRRGLVQQVTNTMTSGYDPLLGRCRGGNDYV